jgi:hypothetical protein
MWYSTYIGDVEHGAQFTARTRLGRAGVCAEAFVPDEDPAHGLRPLHAVARDRHRRSDERQREESSDGRKSSVHCEVCWDMNATTGENTILYTSSSCRIGDL